MKKKKSIDKNQIIKRVAIMVAMTEVVCGHKFMRWQIRRMLPFSKVTQIEIWLQAGNRILPSEMHVDWTKPLATSPLVQAEAQRIIDRMLAMPMVPNDELVERVSEILSRSLDSREFWV